MGGSEFGKSCLYNTCTLPKKISATFTKRLDRGGGRGYGNVSRKVTRYICQGNLSDSSMDREIPGKRLMRGLVSSDDNSETRE